MSFPFKQRFLGAYDPESSEQQNYARAFCSLFAQSGIIGAPSYSIDYSLRLRAANNSYLTKTTGSAAPDRKYATVSIWIKRGALGGRSTLYSINSAGSAGASNQITMSFDNAGSNGDNLNYNNGSVNRTSTSVYRDSSAYMHFHQVFDTTQATAADRVKTAIDGVILSDINIGQDFSLNSNTPFGQATVTEYLGRRDTGFYFDGLFAEVIIIVGQALPASSFGEVDASSGQWVPKRYAGTFGTNDSYLPFKNASSTSTIGYDYKDPTRGGTPNDWTTSGISVTAGHTFDQLTDTPTKNFATLDPDNKSDSSAVIANGNLAYTSGNNRYAASSVRLTTGKWYGEAGMTVAPTTAQFIVGFSFRASAVGASAEPGFSSDTHAIYVPSLTGNRGYWTNSAQVFNIGSALDETRTYKWFIDIDAGKAWFGYDTVWWNSAGATTGDPATGANPTFTFTAGTPAWVVLQASSGQTAWINFGQRPFVQTMPAGGATISSNNIAAEIQKVSNGFVLTTDTEANIETSLAALRSGWTDYVEILKNYGASESWAWRFSHDASNEHAAESTDTYQSRASRTMSGSNSWVGYAIRIGTTYGTAAGSAAHTNGVATTITHNLARTRNMVILFPRAGGDIYYSHPDLTAGNLLKLNSTNGQTASTIITSVGSNSFQIGSGAASGTYDYLVISDVAGFCKLFGYSGNSSADGPVVDFNLKMGLLNIKDRSATSGQRVYDSARNPKNGAMRTLIFNNTSVDSSENFIVAKSNGMKLITGAGSGVNDSSSIMVGFCFAVSPFKYATAR